jgi:hypothetical protein
VEFCELRTYRVSKYENAAGSLPRSHRRRRRRAVGISESVASLEAAIAEWRGYAVTYPTKYKRFRVAFPRSSLREGHATIGTNEDLAIANDLHIASSAMRTWSCSPTAPMRALVVGSPRDYQTALRAKQLAFGVHQPTRVASRWLTALILVAPFSLSDVSRGEE